MVRRLKLESKKTKEYIINSSNVNSNYNLPKKIINETKKDFKNILKVLDDIKKQNPKKWKNLQFAVNSQFEGFNDSFRFGEYDLEYDQIKDDYENILIDLKIPLNWDYREEEWVDPEFEEFYYNHPLISGS